MTDIISTTKPVKRVRRMAREPMPADAAEGSTSPPATEGAPKISKPASKSSVVLAMLQRPDGATIAQLVTATDWLPHTTRAALTGLKKKGHQVISGKADGKERVYRLVAS